MIGNTLLIDISEHQITYMTICLNKMREDKVASIAPTEEAYREYNEKMAEAIVTSSWATGGCDSWYLDKSGKPNIYPWLPNGYRREMLNVDFSEYRLTGKL